MKLARVVGTVVATVKDPSLNNQKILLIQPLDENLQNAGTPVVAVDTVQAGPRDLVYWTLAREAGFALPDAFTPVDAAITGIVDQVNKDDRGILDKEKIFSGDKK